MASAGMTPAAAGITVQPTVRTRKKVPINSAMYFLILVSWIMKECFQIDSAKFCIGMECGREVIFRSENFRPSFDIRPSSFRGPTARRLHLVPDCPKIVENRFEQ